MPRSKAEQSRHETTTHTLASPTSACTSTLHLGVSTSSPDNSDLGDSNSYTTAAFDANLLSEVANVEAKQLVKGFCRIKRRVMRFNASICLQSDGYKKGISSAVRDVFVTTRV
uniref:Uncharacterized protein n=1 Tax=Mesocestoides corti TaxID=53468 RepID=A0A5K3FJZ5_MESCO